MRCKKAKRAFSALLDGELRPRRRVKVEEHLRRCPACRDELDALIRCWDVLTEVEEIHPSPQFEERFWYHFRQEEREEVKRRAPYQWIFERPLILLSALGVVVLVIGVSLLSYFPRRTTPPSGDVSLHFVQNGVLTNDEAWLCDDDPFSLFVDLEDERRGD